MRLLALSLLLTLSACVTPTLRTGDEAEVQLYLVPSGDVIVEAPRPIDFGNVRLVAESVRSPYLLSPEPSAYGYYTVALRNREAIYGSCVRIKAEGVTAGWVGVTLEGGEYSEAKKLDTRPRKPPEGC